MAIARIGTGCTVVFSSGSTFAGLVTGFKLSGEEVGILDITTLASTGYRKLRATALKSPPQAEVEIQYDPGNVPPVGTAATLTITYPDPDGASSETAETLTGTGFFVSQSSESPLEEVMTGTFVWQFDGATGPTYS